VTFWSSLRFSLRILRKHWKLTSIGVFSLAIAMAAGAVGFSVFNTLLLRPPAVVEPAQLLTIYSASPTEEFGGFCYDDYKYFRDNNQVFSGVMAFPYSISVTPLLANGRSKDGLFNTVSDTFFSVLGVQPMLGRVFEKGDDDKPSSLAVLSYPYWKWLGANPNLVGNTVQINGKQLTIIGVMPRGFAGTVFSDLPDVWYPLSTEAAMNGQGQDWRTDRTARPLRLVGRLKPGVTRAQVIANLETLSKQLAAAYPKTNENRVARVTDTSMLPVDSVSSARIISTLILAIVALVLFAACSNVANLLLALTSARRHEILVRAAMGATRGRLTREVILDSTVIAAGGGALGFFLAYLGMAQLMRYKPYIPGFGPLPLTIDFRPDLTVLLVTIGLVFVVGLAAGFVPALYSSTPNLAGALSGEIAVGGTHKGRIRNSLVAIQVAVCTLVLIGVGLCLRSFNNIREVNLGFSARNVAILTTSVQSVAPSEDAGRKLFSRMRDAAEHVYGVESVTLTGDLPVSQNDGNVEKVRIADSPAPAGSGESIAFMAVDDNYFSTLGVPLLMGRIFSPADGASAPGVVVVNHFLAQKYWPGHNPIGKTIRLEDGNRVVTVVGVVGDGKYVEMDEPARPFIYFDLNQRFQPYVYLLARTKGAPRQWLNPLADALQKIEPLPAIQKLTLDDWLNFNLLVPEITLFCVALFGGLAFSLAAVGLYGAVFYSVSERKKELGIRVALGASPRDLWTMILRQTGFVTAAGVGLGTIAGGIASMLVRSLLFGIRPVEWFVFAAVALTMALMTVLIAYSAARPWLHADPMESVRHA
jgi:macrolide transport system ATP-binding/permease protein